MKTIKLIDMTLALLPTLNGSALTFKEKLEIARGLDRLKVDGIELAPIAGGKADQLAGRTIAAMVAAPLIAAVDVAAGNVEETWESVRGARQPRLNLLAPLSPVQMEYACHKKAPAMLEAVVHYYEVYLGVLLAYAVDGCHPILAHYHHYIGVFELHLQGLVTHL